MMITKFLNKRLFFFLIVLFYSFPVFSEPAFFNDEKTLGIDFHLNKDSKTITIDYIGYMKNPPSASGFRAVVALKNALSLLIDKSRYEGTKLPLSIPANSEHKFVIEIRTPPLSKTLAQVSYKPDFGFTSNNQNISKLAVAFFRELGQVNNPQDVIHRWIHRNQTQINRDLLKPAVDLHTHFTGALKTESILEIAERKKIPYPRNLLDELMISSEELEKTDNGNNVYLSRSKFSQKDWSKLKKSMTLHTFQVATFSEMELKYRYRSPITKHAPSFGDFLWALAKDYQEFGIKYAELSISDIVKDEFLEIAKHVLPEIEKKTHVKLRFLVGMWRHMPNPFDNFNLLTKIKELNCPEIVGIDIMGHESNPTKDLVPLIQKAAQYKSIRPHFVIRVHAGENDNYPKNVEEAIAAGATRIGHGINGITDDVLNAAIANNIMIEINVNSNIALSNIQNLDQVIQTLKSYLAKGVKITLGSDGHGLYETCNASEFESLRYLGITPKEFQIIKSAENEYLKAMQEGYDRDVLLAKNRPDNLGFKPIFTGDQWNVHIKSKKEKIARLQEEVSSRNVPFIKDLSELDAYESEKIPVMIVAGGSSHWLNMDNKTQTDYTKLVTHLKSILDPNKTFFVTSGTELGIDESVHSDEKNQPITSPLGIIPANIFPELIAKNIRAAMIMGENWIERNTSVISFINRRKGLVIFLSTGENTKDLLVNTINLRRERKKGLTFLVNKQSESTIQKFLDRIEPELLFSDIPDLTQKIEELQLTRPGHAPMKSLSVDAWKDFVPKRKPLPFYCSATEIQDFAQSNYDYNFSSPTNPNHTDHNEISEFIRTNNNQNRFFPEGFRNLINQTVIYYEFKDYAQLFGHSSFSLDPRFFYYFFSQMNSSEILSFLNVKLKEGRKISQELAKICIYLDRFSVENLDELPIPSEWPFLMETKAQDLSVIFNHKKLKLNQFRENGFILSEDHPPKVNSSNTTKRLILVRGVSRYNHVATNINKAMREKGFDSIIFGTDAHRTESWVKHYEITKSKLGHLELKNQSRLKNQKVFTKLIEIQYPIIIFSTQGTNPQESFTSYVKAAEQEGYKIDIVKASLASKPIKEYARKTEKRAFQEVESWIAEELDFDGIRVPQQSFEEFMNQLRK